MDGNWASDNLQVIRTLMERAALYRRALAPIMIAAGAIGIAGATLPCWVDLSSPTHFSLYWMALSFVGLAAAYVLVRRQAWKAQEPFWSPPTRRVTRALAPPFVVGLAGGSGWALGWVSAPVAPLVALWLACYGCGLHAAGFWMRRGIRLLGWWFVLLAIIWFFGSFTLAGWQGTEAAHYAMGATFGLLQLAYGVYLHFSERIRAAR